jgi:hypothetical protein
MKIRTLILTTVISASILSSHAQASGLSDIIGGVGTAISGTVRGASSIVLGAGKLPFDVVKFAWNNPKTTTAVIAATLAVAYTCHHNPTLAPNAYNFVMGGINTAGKAILRTAGMAYQAAQPYMQTAQSHASSAWTTASGFVKNIPTQLEDGFTAFDSSMIAIKDSVAGKVAIAAQAGATSALSVADKVAIAAQAGATSALSVADKVAIAAQAGATSALSVADKVAIAAQAGATSALSVAGEVVSDMRIQAGAAGFLGSMAANRLSQKNFTHNAQ